MFKILRLNSAFRRPAFLKAYPFSTQFEDPYKILGIRRGCSFKEAQAAFYKLSKTCHPDVSKDKDATKRFQELSSAFEQIKTSLKGSGAAADGAYNQGTKPDFKGDPEHSYKGYGFGQGPGTNSEKTGEDAEEGEQGFRDSSGSGFKGFANQAEYEEYMREKETRGMTEEEKIYYKIFNKSFRDDPSFFYKPENQKLREQFEAEIRNARRRAGKPVDESAKEDFTDQWKTSNADTGTYTREPPRYTNQNYSGVTAPPMESGMAKIFAVSCLALLAGGFYLFNQERTASKEKFERVDKPAPHIDVEELRVKHLQKEKEKEEKKISDFLTSLAPMKKYPKKNPRAIDMLVDYTIWPDIKLYQVDQDVFYKDQVHLKHSDEFDKAMVHNVRINTLISLALEVERIFKLTSVKVDDVMKEMKENGYYRPPGVFFRFMGLLYAKIRQKPIIPENLQEHIKLGEKYITLFDLFFRYTTPILVANPDYYEIPLYHDVMRSEFRSGSGPMWVGNVTINHRPMAHHHINEKMHNLYRWYASDNPGSDETIYILTWRHFYQTRKPGTP